MFRKLLPSPTKQGPSATYKKTQKTAFFGEGMADLKEWRCVAECFLLNFTAMWCKEKHIQGNPFSRKIRKKNTLPDFYREVCLSEVFGCTLTSKNLNKKQETRICSKWDCQHIQRQGVEISHPHHYCILLIDVESREKDIMFSTFEHTISHQLWFYGIIVQQVNTQQGRRTGSWGSTRATTSGRSSPILIDGYRPMRSCHTTWPARVTTTRIALRLAKWDLCHAES